jgi:hypothetical protein
MRKFSSKEDVEELTDVEALEIIRQARERLVNTTSYSPYALDDGGDYINAAIENYAAVFGFYWDNDGDHTAFLAAMKQWLREPTEGWGATDGEIRFDLFTQEYFVEEGY